MTAPDIDDASGNYAMPPLGFNDYLPVTDPTTDQTAGQNNTGNPGANQQMTSTAAMTHTSRRCWARFLGNATTPTIAVSNGHDAHWGSGSPVKPTVAHTGTGTYTMTWPATVTDALGQSHTVNLRWAKVQVEGATPYWPPQCSVTSPNVVTVYTFDTGHSANDLVGVTIFVEAG